jgi:hypothetical protein
MRKLFLFLLAVVFMLHTTFVVAAPRCTNCPDIDCPSGQCVSVGCLPSAMPAMVAALAGMQPIATAAPATDYASAELPSPLQEIWTPPD